jgi:hypothetical protein
MLASCASIQLLSILLGQLHTLILNTFSQGHAPGQTDAEQQKTPTPPREGKEKVVEKGKKKRKGKKGMKRKGSKQREKMNMYLFICIFCLYIDPFFPSPSSSPSRLFLLPFQEGWTFTRGLGMAVHTVFKLLHTVFNTEYLIA